MECNIKMVNFIPMGSKVQINFREFPNKNEFFLKEMLEGTSTSMDLYIRYNQYFPYNNLQQMLVKKVKDENVINIIRDFFTSKDEGKNNFNEVISELKDLMICDRDDLCESFNNHEGYFWSPTKPNDWKHKKCVFDEIAYWEHRDVELNRKGVQSILEGNSPYRNKNYGYYCSKLDDFRTPIYDGPFSYYQEKYEKYKAEYDHINRNYYDRYDSDDESEEESDYSEVDD